MALGTPTLLDSSTDSGNDSDIQSGSISPTGDAMLIVAVVSRQSSQSRTITSVSDTLTGTGSWTIDVATVGTASGYVNVTIATATAGSSPGSGTITANLSGNSARKIMHVAEITGHDTTTPITQTKSNTGSSSTLSMTLDSSPDSAACVLGAVGTAYDGTGSGVSPGTNYTELVDTDGSFGAGNIVHEVEYDSTPTSTTVDWSSLNTINNAGVAVEIAEAATGPTYSLTAAAGSLSFTGTATGLTVGRKLTAAAGTLSFTGTATTFTYTRTLTAAAGSLTLEGNLVEDQTKLIYTRKIPAEAGTLSLTGTATGLTVGRKLTAAAGALTFTGTDTGLTYTPVSGYSPLVAEAGTLSFAGTAAGLTVSRKLTAQTNTLTFTGTTTNFTYTRTMTAAAGSLTIAGPAAGLTLSRALTAGAGSLTFAGVAAGLSYSGVALQIITASLNCNPSPILTLSSNPTPDADLNSNPSPAVTIETV